ncbi:hypothetical protein CN689_06010 [Peribacillus butanolivorans]|uniref:Uncharacterized protein n=1 Tax=Peribacillus butanolivorans TaxID=421767 RepID=A0AAX0RSJ9_9BACI|nr:hypothetical protein [Peribacillus butanolivorans]PEJ35993.1 hypothetical protein CN689_06010 [Peribacillus butanolivorans]
MDCLPKKSEVLLDEEIEKQEFVKIINSIYKQECYIYAVIPEWEEELFNELSNDFIIINKIRFTLTRIFPRTIGFLGYVKDRKKQYIYEFYLVYNNGFFSVFRDGCISTFKYIKWRRT